MLPFSHAEYKLPKPKGDKYPKELKTIGDHIRKRRLDLGLFQKDVAEIIGTSCIDSIRKWELGQGNPQIHHMPKVIEFLGYLPFRMSFETLGDRVRVHRILNGLSHKSMGREFKVDASTIGSWEKNEFEPHSEMLMKLNIKLDATFSSYARILK